MMIVKNLFLFILLNLLSFSMIAQDRGEGAWWPSIHGADDEAGAPPPARGGEIMEALSLPQEGKVYELGHPYERIQPAYLDRPYRLNIVKRASPTSVSLTEYFTGYIGQMGTQYDALGHQGRFVQNEDGESHYIFYNGFTDDDLIGDDLGADGIQHLGVEGMKPIITKGLLIDIAGYKGVRTLSTNYVVTLSDVLETLEWQGMSEDDIEIGDAILFNYGWSVHWGNPAKYNDGYVGRGENQGSPGIYTEVARWLLTKDISIVGADSCCVEVRPNPGTESVHHLLFLEQGIPILENLDLIELANDRTYEFLLIALNERMVGATGSMIRPIAIR